MKSDNLATYLNDHLAGSVGAIEMIEHLIKTCKDRSMEQFYKKLHSEVNSDQDELRELMRGLQIKESSVRKTSAWILEKISRPKLGLISKETDEIDTMQALEGLLLGIRGKEALWSALEVVTERGPQLRRFDFKRLEKRAIEQGERVEGKRLEVACQSLL